MLTIQSWSKMGQTDAFLMNQEIVEHYLQQKLAQGVSETAVAKYRTALLRLIQWGGDGCLLTAEDLREWRKSLEDYGYSKYTVQAYVKVINDFLRSFHLNSFCIPKPIRMQLQGNTYGYLTVLEPTEKRRRKDLVWRCVCKCGKEIEVPTTLLLTGNTTSCGCLNAEILQHVNRYVEGTSLRQALEDKPVSLYSASGYTGVFPKKDKWQALINYKGVRYNLGTYTKVEEAAAARARAKAWVMEDAAKLYEEYGDCYGEMPHRPKKPEKYILPKEKASDVIAKRSDNTSGHTGITKKYNKWSVSISFQGKRYPLGVYEALEDAVAIRKQAEACVREKDINRLEMICTRHAVQKNTQSIGQG